MTDEQKKHRYYNWVREQRCLSLMLGKTWEEPVKEDGTDEDDINILWNFYTSTIKRQLDELVIKLTELERKTQ
jgi:hypothetical protein